MEWRVRMVGYAQMEGDSRVHTPSAEPSSHRAKSAIAESAAETPHARRSACANAEACIQLGPCEVQSACRPPS
jgi:hypothetical protein